MKGGRRSKTSEDILRERDAFQERVRALEEALGCIAAELEAATEQPDSAVGAALRARSIVRAQLAMPPRKAGPSVPPEERSEERLRAGDEAPPPNGQRVA